MIVYWLKRLAVYLLRLVRSPKNGELAFVDPNEKCPCCGARDGHLRCVSVTNNQLGCQHTCNVCGCRWLVKPVVALTSTWAQPGVARTTVEEKEDRAPLRLLIPPAADAAVEERAKAS